MTQDGFNPENSSFVNKSELKSSKSFFNGSSFKSSTSGNEIKVEE